MRKWIFGLAGLAGLALLVVSCNNNPKGDKASTTEAVEGADSLGGNSLAINTAHSRILWTGSKVTGSHHGTIAIKSGELFVEDNKLTGGHLVIDMTSLENEDLSGENKAKLEGHLKSGDFFDVEKYPESEFKITEVNYENDITANISGNLTLKGITKNVTFKGNISSSTDEQLVASADFNINRKDWGIVYTGMQDDLIADEINFKVELQAAK